MPSLADHQSNTLVKALLGGDSGTGKTGSLTSLVAAGYKLRILDFDNGLDILKGYVLEQCPDKIDNVEYRTLRDKRAIGDEGLYVKDAKTWPTTLKMLNNWKYGKVDLGVPATWGPECVLVIDSLSRLCDAAFDFYEPLVPTGKGGDKDGRAIFYAAQQGVAEVLSLLTSEGFATNVIICAHIRYIDMPDGTTKGFPRAVGSALSPDIPTYFNTLLEAQTIPGGKKQIKTIGTGTMDLKNPRPFALAPVYPIGSGMGRIFKVLLDPSLNDRKKKEGETEDAQHESTPSKINRRFA